MKWTGVNDLREAFLKFYESKGHLILPSFGLIPKDDNEPAAHQLRHGADEELLPGHQDSAQKACNHLPEVHPYPGY